MTVVESVYSAVRTDSLYKADYVYFFKRLNLTVKFVEKRNKCLVCSFLGLLCVQVFTCMVIL
jgi:hypothetical protein